jgi:hypothetical protein
MSTDRQNTRRPILTGGGKIPESIPRYQLLIATGIRSRTCVRLISLIEFLLIVWVLTWYAHRNLLRALVAGDGHGYFPALLDGGQE